MRKPSVKKLESICGNEKHLALELRRVFEMKRPQLFGYIEDIEPQFKGPMYLLRLTALNKAGNFMGVESAQSSSGEWLSFLNSGDVYNGTVIYWRGKYRVQSLGDFIETMERNGIKFN